MSRHVTEEDNIVDPTGIMSGSVLAPIIDASAAKTAMGLGNVENTTDMGKPVSTAAQVAIDAMNTAIALKENTADALQKSNNLSDLPSANTARNNLGLSPVANSGSYADLVGTPTIPAAQVQSDWVETDTGLPDFIKNKPTRSYTSPSRSLNTAFQISATRDTVVVYSIDIVTSLSLTGGQVGTVYLRYADDSAHTTNVVTVSQGTNGNTGTLTIGLALSQTVPVTLGGSVPLGKYAKIVTANNTGTPTFTLQRAQEVLL